MAILYMDPVGGNDANNGSSYALRFKTFTSGATAARIAPGDTIRIMASPLPTSLGVNATFTNLSDTITLASPLTANISTCETAWTASANVTCSTSATRKEGNLAVTHAIADGFTTGLVAYLDLGSNQDFSSYEQVSFWIWQTAGSTLHASGVFEIKLCSDAAGTTPVDTIVVPSFGGTNMPCAFTVGRTGGGVLGNAIRSIALYAVSDPGAVTVAMDNIIAVKAASSADSISLTSLIGKNTAGETWYAIRSINGTTVKLDHGGGTFTNTTARGYSGTTATVTGYIRECFRTPVSVTAGTIASQVQDSGSDGSQITFSGGWNRTDMSTQLTGEDGYSYFDGVNNIQFGIGINNSSNITLERIGAVRYDYGVYTGSSCTALYMDYVHLNCNQRVGFGSTGSAFRMTNGFCCNNGQQGYIISTGQNVYLDTLVANSNTSNGLSMSTATEIFGKSITAKNNGTYAMSTSRANIKFAGFTSSDNATAAISNTGTRVDLINSSMAEATEVVHVVNYSNWKVTATNHDGSTNQHRTWVDGGLISSETGANRRTASGIGWSMAPTSTLRTSTNPLILPVAKIACNANSLVTVKMYVNRTNTGITSKLVCRGGQIAGVASDVTATAAGSAGSWEELTISFTPTEAGVVEIEAHAYGGTTYTVYLDDMTITQA